VGRENFEVYGVRPKFLAQGLATAEPRRRRRRQTPNAGFDGAG
jgi:hypothetical protein